MKCDLIHGDCLKELVSLGTNSFDSLVTDPPAGISFMSHGWDDDKGGSEQWVEWLSQVMRECLRVLKPGGHGLIWAIPRTSHWTGRALELAGFEIRDVVSHIFSSGFPKSSDLGGGWGTNLKPAVEFWWLVRKPLEPKKTIREAFTSNGVGGININTSRVGMKEDEGRWPANLVLSHASECVFKGTKKVDAPVINRFKDGMKPFGEGAGHEYTSVQTGDENGQEDVAIYECVEGCAIKILDAQSGTLKSGKVKPQHKRNSKIGFQGTKNTSEKGANLHGYGDEGGASRFFKNFEPEELFQYASKVSTSEKNEGLDPKENTHPTVKAQGLMSYLVKLITPPGGLVLDPFAGSGSTLVAAIENGFNVVGIEQSQEYVTIARKRLIPVVERRQASEHSQTVQNLFEGLPQD
jgi:DNA modification methylase